MTVTLPDGWNGAFRYASCFRPTPGTGMGDPQRQVPEAPAFEVLDFAHIVVRS